MLRRWMEPVLIRGGKLLKMLLVYLQTDRSGQAEHLVPIYIEFIIPVTTEHLNPEHEHHNIKGEG
jgi:hypothetical protein